MANCVRCGRQLPGLTFGKKICQWCVQHEKYQRGEITDDAPQPIMRTPWVSRGESTISLTQIIFGANLAVFLATAYASSTVMDFPGDVLVWGATVGPYTLSGQWWRLLSYMFLHGGLMHIAFNMWCLWDLGALCESLYGRWTFAAIYFITGIGAGIASVGWNPHVFSVGASGAIFGLAGALIASFYLGEFSMPRAALSGTLRSLLFFAGFNLFFGQVVGGIDNACHIGGLITGLILGALIAKISPQHDNPMRRAVIFLVMALALVGSALGVQRWRGFSSNSGRAGISERNMDQMIAALKQTIRERPADVQAHSALARAYFAEGKLVQGEDELKHVLQLQPQNASARMNLGAAYLSEEKSHEAQQEFTELLKQEPNNAQAHVGLGMALADEQDHPAAIEEYKTALRLDPKASDVNYRMGVSLAKLKQYDDAIAAFLKEQQSGDDYELESALADAYQAKGMTQKAEDARSKAAQLKKKATD
jgi:rhomboid protease GluP